MTVDIIMPCYYSSKIIHPCMEKIASQTLIKNITLIMINDSSPNTDCEYQDLIDEFSDRINIRYFKTEKRSGPGVARQIGLDNATSDWIWFQDDDDEPYDEYTFEYLIDAAKKEDYNQVAAIMGQAAHTYLINGERVIKSWYHSFTQGTIINRKTIQDNNVHFEEELSYKEEDCAFSELFLLKLKNQKLINCDKPVYLKKWFHDHNSLTRTVNSIDSIISLMGAKALNGLHALEMNSTRGIGDVVFCVPHLVNALIKELDKVNQYLTLEQYNKVLKYINIYNLIMNNYSSYILNLDIDHYFEVYRNLLNKNNFYGEPSKQQILEFKSKYYDYIHILNQYIK